MPTSHVNIFPHDGVKHVASMDCPCAPQVKTVAGVGRAVVHNRLDNIEVPDTIPEEWEKK